MSIDLKFVKLTADVLRIILYTPGRCVRRPSESRTVAGGPQEAAPRVGAAEGKT